MANYLVFIYGDILGHDLNSAVVHLEKQSVLFGATGPGFYLNTQYTQLVDLT